MLILNDISHMLARLYVFSLLFPGSSWD